MRMPISGGRWLAPGLLGAAALASAVNAQVGPAPQSAYVYASQGWAQADRDRFYLTAQGSRIMPYAWFKALRRLNSDELFAGDQLQRYGYLTNDSAANVTGLPLGFVVDPKSNDVGMTCAACHTSELSYSKDGQTHRLRVDGAPARADFQQFLTDLSAASEATLSDPRFSVFAHDVLGAGYSKTAARQLRSDLSDWVQRFGDFMDASLPKTSPWGPGRLDAFGMIFNRVGALDIDQSSNLALANAPVRYPFLWNAHRQDVTQWTGAVPNGLYVLALARNTGEVMGVFADSHPRVLVPTVVDYGDNSVSFSGLESLEEELVTLKPPAWPRDQFGFNPALAAAGKPLFDQNCASCHGEQPSDTNRLAWKTLVRDVGTDPAMAQNTQRGVATGLFKDSVILPSLDRFQDQASATQVLRSSVTGALVSNGLSVAGIPGVWRAVSLDAAALRSASGWRGAGLASPGLRVAAQPATPGSIDDVKSQLRTMYAATSPPGGAAYEARVLRGIWAAAPYLHNGSVPNLVELLTPPLKRHSMLTVRSREFDPKVVGFATDPTLPPGEGPFAAAFAGAAGNSNQGHDYGTQLTDRERLELIEYLKSLN